MSTWEHSLVRAASGRSASPCTATGTRQATVGGGAARSLAAGSGSSAVASETSSHLQKLALLEGQMTVRDMIGRGNGLQEVLDYLMCFAEAQIDGPIHVAALLLNRVNLAFRLAAAPSL